MKNAFAKSIVEGLVLVAAVVGLLAGRAEAQVAWTPSNITVAAWYDAADAGTVLTSGSAVTNWLDKSGNGLHLSQGTPENQPATGASINSLNALDFTGDFMATASNPFAPTVSNAFVIAVHKVDAIANGTLFSLTGSDPVANRWNGHAPWSDGIMYFDCGDAAVPNRINSPYGVSTGSVVLASFYCSTADNVQQVYKNGSILTNDSSGHAVSTVGNITVGGIASSYQDTTLGEFIIINGTVSATTREKLEGYLAHKWGLQANLPANHPYKGEPPLAILSASVINPANGSLFLPGSSITATVAVANGTAPYDVTFYTNSAVAWSTNGASTNLFTIPLGALANGTYTHYATVTDSVSSNATSSTNTFTLAPDTTAPTPNPMTFAVAPASINETTIVMTATTATDAFSPPVQYYFENTTNSANSGWITGTVWNNTGLAVGTTYGYTVKARDALSNETAVSP